MIEQELLILFENWVPVVIIMIIMLIVSVITRQITVIHFARHHLDEVTQKHIRETQEYTEMLLKERAGLTAELKRLRVMVKGARECLGVNAWIEELEAVKP